MKTLQKTSTCSLHLEGFTYFNQTTAFKCPYDFPLSSKSLASLIFAANRGDPPRSGWFRAIILLCASYKVKQICSKFAISLFLFLCHDTTGHMGHVAVDSINNHLCCFLISWQLHVGSLNNHSLVKVENQVPSEYRRFFSFNWWQKDKKNVLDDCFYCNFWTT